MKKLFSMLLVFVLSLSLVGCSSDEPKTDDPASKEPAKITIWAWDPNFNIAIMEEAKERYLKVNPDVEFEIVDMAKADVEQKLLTNLSSGLEDGLPDIVLIEDYNAQKYLKSFPGSFADLTNSFKYDDFLSYKVGLMTVDQKVYGVPFDTGASAFFYRKDILEEAGYTTADLENITWNQYLEIGKDVLEKTGKKLLALDFNDGGLMRVMLQSAGSWYYDANGVVNFTDNPGLKATLETHKAIYDSGIYKPTTGWAEWVGAINDGSAASITTGVWIVGSIKAAADQSGLWAVAPTPRLDVENSVNASNLGGSSWYVLDSSKSKDTAIDFLNKTYASDVDFYQKILADRGAVGSFIPSTSGAAYSNEDEFFGGQKVFTDISGWAEEIPALSYGMYTYECDAAILSVMKDYLDGKITIDQALEAAENQAKSQINN